MAISVSSTGRRIWSSAADYAYPSEVEEVLYEHPAGAGVAVIGVPHSDLGEEVVPLWRSSRA